MDQHRQSLLDPNPPLFMPPAASTDKQDFVAPAAQPAWVTGILSAFSAYPKVLLSIVVLLLLMLLLSIASIVLLIQTKGECDASDSSAPLTCGYGGHDLSSIATDLPPYQFSKGGSTYTYYLHTCGPLITTACKQFQDSQACMRISPANNAYDIADYKAGNGGGTWSQGDSGEVVYSSSSGGVCPTDELKQLSLRVSYTCNQQQTQPIVTEVFNGLDPCQINFIVATSAVC
jgi:hypothetical protein